ncbi:hypothetical protein [Xenorhabdus sp. PB62.4]|uniref:hypothetical protein n=1 Tax=Xenorhabdus sp. PB62.4 TaxID=1851573 RepID=UPI001656B4E6|nr:hypothetical protein [Xenorhabdus sp. PB62.4]MBC8954985.1 hypothetical protein [Xenorhabdus sp. PB62.4]
MSGEISDPEFHIGATASEQMNIMAMISSKIVQKDLTDFYKFWKFPLTQKTISTISDYELEKITGFALLPSELIKNQPESNYDMHF